MFERLKQKWGVNALQLTLILITFAVGGSCCGYLGRLVLNALSIENEFVRIPLYIILVTLLWPVCVLVISIFTGQFPFFRNYLKKMGRYFTKKRG